MSIRGHTARPCLPSSGAEYLLSVFKALEFISKGKKKKVRERKERRGKRGRGEGRERGRDEGEEEGGKYRDPSPSIISEHMLK